MKFYPYEKGGGNCFSHADGGGGHKKFPLQGGGGGPEKFTLSQGGGGGAQKVSEPQFSHFVHPSP